jgi:hypothetical protein
MFFELLRKRNRIQTGDLDQFLRELILEVESREQLWTKVLNRYQLREVTEIGVFKGEFAAYLLKDCPGIIKYHLIDPWSHLDNWNKPANVSNGSFGDVYRTMMENTSFSGERRIIHKGKSIDILPIFKDESQDFIYVDGDHTLRGITIDLQSAWPKIKWGGIIGGDDFTASIWQHDQTYEPSLIFPYTVYFSEAVGATLYALPFDQFLLHKVKTGYKFIDLTGAYSCHELRNQFQAK